MRPLALALLLGALTAPLSAQTIELPVLDLAGDVPDNGTQEPILSSDGSTVGFVSSANDLVASPPPGTGAYVVDRGSGSVELVSVTASGTPSAFGVSLTALSSNARYVAFDTADPNITSPPAPAPIFGEHGFRNVFVLDRTTDTAELVSFGDDGSQPRYGGEDAALSADGRWVAFVSEARLDPGSLGHDDIYLRDRVGGGLTLVSRSNAGGAANAESLQPDVSDDGTRVVFTSSATNLLLPTRLTTGTQVFVRDIGGLVDLVSVGPSGFEADAVASTPQISGDGTCVAFTSAATNLVAGDDNGVVDVFVRDLDADTIERVSVASDGTQADGPSDGPAISDDGRFVAFRSFASNLGPGDGSPFSDVYVHDRLTGETRRVSESLGGGTAYGFSHAPSISGDGAVVAFQSDASNFVTPFDDNGSNDVIVFDADGVPAPFSALGFGIAGGNGVPCLTGGGSLQPGAPFTLELAVTLPDPVLVVGASTELAPLKGGVLVPKPTLLVTGLPYDPITGVTSVTGNWPAGLPQGAQVFMQAWISDFAAVKEFAASPGLVATQP